MTPEEERQIADKILKKIEEQFGFVPLVNQILSRRPDLFVPLTNASKAGFEGERKKLDSKTTYLIAVGAAAALGGEHCVKVQGTHALEAGATEDEILEAIYIASFMALNRAQSYGFRGFESIKKD